MDTHFRPDAQNSDEPRLTLAQVREFLPRYRWVIALTFAATVVSAYAALSLMTELYEARAALLVKLGRENLDPPPTARNSVLSTGVRREDLGSEAQLLHSTDLLARVVDTIGPARFKPHRVVPSSLAGKVKFYAKAALRSVKTQYQEALIALDLKKRLGDRDAAIELLNDQLSVEPQKDADVIAMRLRLADPTLAVHVERALIDEYLARRIQVHQDAGALEFLESQVRDRRDALARAETARNEWKQTRDLTVPAEQKALLLRQIRELSADRTKTRVDRDALAHQLGAAERIANGSAERVQTASEETPNPAFQLLNERLAKLQADRAHLLTTYQPNATTVRIIQDEIAGVSELIASQQKTQLGSVTSQLNPLRQQLEEQAQRDQVRLEGLTAADRAQRDELVRLQAELDDIERADARLVELERDRQVAEQSYLAAVARRDEAEVAARLDISRISNVSVAMAPTAAPEPVYPRKLLIMAIALALGLALSVGVAILLEWTSEAVRDAEQVESLTELVCLGSVAFGGSGRRGATA